MWAGIYSYLIFILLTLFSPLLPVPLILSMVEDAQKAKNVTTYAISSSLLNDDKVITKQNYSNWKAWPSQESKTTAGR